ncbi:MAG TPA: LuxR C-terminal-related transcriptional regulator, partial [Ideonella sp.]|nr:LuxR C-terminal-related transcriptional regulator [Ideonella sp.]
MLSTLSNAPDVGDAFLRAAEAAHHIGSPQQFFVWLRLHLYRFLPHDLALICVDGGRAGGRQAYVLNCVALPDGLQEELSDPTARFWYALAEAWAHEGERAAHVSLHERPFAALASAGRLAGGGFDQALVHALRSPGGSGEELLVAFLRRGHEEVPPDLARCALDLWMPYLRFALDRAHAGSAVGSGRRVKGRADLPAPRPLTDRELQVLSAVREAKANAQIAVMLGISPLTVKNHLRSIQKKLGARNRVHAVAEAMA